MGLFDRFRRTTVAEAPQPQKPVINSIVGAEKAPEDSFQSYTNSNITFSGSLAGYDYDNILRNKQENIVSLYQLADYYTDADPIVRGIVRHVFVPFSTCSGYFLTGNNTKTIKLYDEQYRKMRIQEKLDGIMTEYWKYSNVFIYLLNGQLITLPVHKCKIGSVALNGMPLVDFDCQSILNEWRAKTYAIHEGWIEENNLEKYFEGYPPEVQEALNMGYQYAQLDPANTFVMQGSKESWQRYSIPFIAACLSPLAKKELISNYENAMLNLATRGFIHVRYGDDKKGADMLPDAGQLGQIQRIFARAMTTTKTPLAVTNHLAKAEFVQADMDDLFQWDKYRDVNNDILSAGGVSGIIVSGVSQDGSTFASAQVSMQTAEARINAARDEFCDVMNRVNARLAEIIPGTYNLKETPEFHFMPLDMSGKKALREACKDLWTKGVVSTKTMLETSGYSMDKEMEQREAEAEEADSILVPRDQTQAPSNGKVGRPELEDDERKSDPEASARAKQPKPSSPEGSMDDET